MSVECIRTLYATPIKMKKHTLKIMLCKKKKTCKMDHSIRRLKRERAYKGIEKEKETKQRERHDKYCTQAKWLNSLIKSPQWSRQLLQPTLRREGDTRLTGASSKKGIRAESPPTFI